MNTIEILEKLKSAYKSIYDPEGKEANFVGVYVLRWGEEYNPTIGFVELSKEEIEAIDVAIKAIKENVELKIKIKEIEDIKIISKTITCSCEDWKKKKTLICYYWYCPWCGRELNKEETGAIDIVIENIEKLEE